jgi:predicted DNA-binding protein (UPF0251 family)
MAYKTEELEKMALDILKKDRMVVFIEEISHLMGISKKTFYERKLHESDTIKEALLENKRFIKANLRKKWYNNDNATTQIALYRLTADKDEFEALTQNKTDITTQGEKVETIQVQIIKPDEPTKD